MAAASHELTDVQRAYVEWTLDPNRSTKEAFAKANGCSTSTMRSWETKVWFQQAVRERMVELNISPTRLQDVLDAMYREAKSGNVQAAKVYLGYLELLNPTKPIEQRDRVEDLTDEELEAYLLA